MSAWGWEAHKLVCALAEEQLTPTARTLVDRLMEDGAELKKGGRNFAESCLWPDNVKYSSHQSTYEHHFINVPSDALSVDFARDCAAINCTAASLQQALTYLSQPTDGDRSELRRAAALRFLGHYVGDMHQPLHVGNSADWGGNKITVRWRGEETNLHAMWDYVMPEKMGLKHPDSVRFLMTVTSNLDPDYDNVPNWFNESLALARSHAYVDEHGKLIKPGATVSDDYFERAKPILIERIALAGARLADMLNRIAEGEHIQVFVLSSQ